MFALAVHGLQRTALTLIFSVSRVLTTMAILLPALVYVFVVTKTCDVVAASAL